MLDVILYIFFIIIPFFRVFNGSLTAQLHIIIAVAALGITVMGLLFNKLDDYLHELIRYLLPLFISTLAVHFFLRTYDSAQIKITHLEIGGPLILLLWLIKRINLWDFKIAPSRKYILYPALLFMGSGILSFILSPFHLETFEPGLLRRISYIGIFIVAIFEFNGIKDFKKVFNWVLASCFIVVIYGFIQQFGLDWHIWKGAFGRRIFSTFGNPNFYAAWIVLLLPLVMVRYMLTKKWYYLALVIGIFINIYLTRTKGSWVGLAVGLSVFVVLVTLYLLKGDPKRLKKIALSLTVTIIIVATSAITWYSVNRINSLRFRLFTWGATMKMVTEPVYTNPAKAIILGTGIETFKLVYPAYRRPEIFHIEGKHNTETDHAHNEFLEIIYDEGLVGITAYLWLLACVYFVAFKRLSLLGIGASHKSEEEHYLIALIAGTVGMFAHSAMSVHIRFVSSGYILWAFMGFIVVFTAPVGNTKENPEKGNVLIKNFLILLLLFVAAMNSIYASRRFKANIYHNRAIAYSKQRRWPEALRYYKLVQKNHPSFIMGYYFEGNVYNDKLSQAIKSNNQAMIEQNYNMAIETYKKVRSMYPNYVQVHFQEGMLHLKVGNIDEAVKSFRKYLNIVDPVYPFTYYRMGMVKARRENNLNEAMWYMKEALNRSKRDREYINSSMNLANIYILQKNYTNAEEVYKSALKKVPGNKDMLQSLTSLYERTNSIPEALNIYKEMLKRAPGSKKIEEKIKFLQN
ncbi:MAG: tetratricopeptide repeat protein [Elusimicrobia bacterium]|jgi:putative inorganic carbon (HCO3(-)) transporter|nr:tetratricopeptide repeat protein [Elusimicrobiota bacterium]